MCGAIFLSIDGGHNSMKRMLNRRGASRHAVPSASARPGCERGTTLLELVFVTAAMVIVLGGGYTVLTSASNSYGETAASLENLSGSVEVLSRLRTDLSKGKVVSVAADGSSFTFRQPVTTGPGGSIFDAKGEIIWGIQDQSGPRAGGSCTISFRSRRILSEVEQGSDLNRDGDQNDVFEVGELVAISDAGLSLSLPRMRILVVKDDWGGDIDGDGKPDPIFTLDGERHLVLRVGRVVGRDQLQMSVIHVNLLEGES